MKEVQQETSKLYLFHRLDRLSKLTYLTDYFTQQWMIMLFSVTHDTLSKINHILYDTKIHLKIT